MASWRVGDSQDHNEGIKREMRLGSGLAGILASISGGVPKKQEFKKPIPKKAKVPQQNLGFDLASIKALSSWGDISAVTSSNFPVTTDNEDNGHTAGKCFEEKKIDNTINYDAEVPQQNLGLDLDSVKALSSWGDISAVTSGNFPVTTDNEDNGHTAGKCLEKKKIDNTINYDEFEIIDLCDNEAANPLEATNQQWSDQGNTGNSVSAGVKRDAPRGDSKDNKKYKQDQDGDHVKEVDSRANKRKNFHNTEQKQQQENKVCDKKSPVKLDDLDFPQEFTDWTDILQFNDDHDKNWCNKEKERLAKLYGENIITVKYISNQPGKLGYYCEICSSEMHSETSLELHCSGMKHFKKKMVMENLKKSPLDEIKSQDSKPGKQEDTSSSKNKKSKKPPKPPRISRSPPHHGRRSPPPSHRSYSRSGDRRREDSYSRNSDAYDRGRRRYSPLSNSRSYDDPIRERRSGPEFYKRSRRPPTPPPPNISDYRVPALTPPPPQVDRSSGPTGLLLKQVADCTIQSYSDEDLAHEVISLLLKSLTEFYQKKESYSSVHLITETEMKCNILKELQKRSQGDQSTPDSIEDFFSTNHKYSY